jgi:5,10-methenyltetrahydrofolate synthetase
MLNKTELRRSLLATRHAIPAELRARWDAAIGVRVQAWLAAHPVRLLGVYWPINSEPDLRTTYEALAARGVQLALPAVVSRDAALRFAAWTPGDPLVKDAFGVSIPAAGGAVQPDAMLVPCVGFNAGHIRLGYGGGFYDRTLAASPHPLALGIAYQCALGIFEGDAHDIALDAIITECSPIADSSNTL